MLGINSSKDEEHIIASGESTNSSANLIENG